MVLAGGITLLQVAANPYVAVLGKPQTASSRLNLTQAFNSFGTFIGPTIGGYLILNANAQNESQLAMLSNQARQAYRVHEAATVKVPSYSPSSLVCSNCPPCRRRAGERRGRRPVCGNIATWFWASSEFSCMWARKFPSAVF
jgi:hypothetical protein